MDHPIRLLPFAALLLTGILAGCLARGEPPAAPGLYNVRQFVIGSWCFNTSADYGPDYLAPYKAAGFNTIIHCLVNLPRDKQPPRENYWGAALDAADAAGLRVLLHTARPSGPWGHWDGVPLPPDRGGYVEVEDLQWLHARYGRHPALMGYLLSDDAGVTGPAVACARWLKANAPGMVPYVSNVTDPQVQAHSDVPILSRQNYPWDTQTGKTEKQCRELYAHWLRVDSQAGGDYRTALWPILWASDRGGSPSQLRYQAFLPIAYGAQGLFWFAYGPSHADWRPGGRFYESARYCNEYLRDVVGPRVLGCRSVAVLDRPDRATILQMDPDLTVGLLERVSTLQMHRSFSRTFPPHYAMVVDTRTAPAGEPQPPERTVRVAFGPEILGVEVCGRDMIGKKDALPSVVKGNVVTLTLKGGDGVWMELKTKD